jgi:hypothetical protein
VRPGSLAARIAIALVGATTRVIVIARVVVVVLARVLVLARVGVIAYVTATGSIALADDAPDTPLPDISADDLSVRESPSLFHDPGEPLLKLDVVPRPNIVGLGVTEDTHRTAISVGPRAKIMMTGTSWKGYADTVPRDGNENDIARGSRAAIGFAYDFGWLQLDAELSENVLSSPYASGSYRDVSLRISKSHRFSRWVTGWIGLSIGNRTWDGDAPTGEENSTYIMLTIGGTFR